MDPRMRRYPELESLLEQLPGCRLLIDRDYRIVASNDTYRGDCGAGTASPVGRYCYEVSHGYDAPCDQQGESCPRRAAEKTGRADRCVHVHHVPSGTEFVDVEVIPLRDADGAISLFMERMDRLTPAGQAEACVGEDPAFLRMLDHVRRVAASDTTVLLLGETGTGKEVMARAVHDLSRRAGSPFVVVDCAGLAESLFESELFGHERGAFTGAVTRKPGLVESAAGGTLFIDEVGDIPLSLQVKLLRVLESGVFRRVGGTDMLRADFRLVAATHRDLRQLSEQGAFRADLFYRLSPYPIVVPPLRDRPRDIPLLAAALLRRLHGSRVAGFSPHALQVMQAYPYPGNVRELRNVVERAALMAAGETIEVHHLPDALRPAADAPSPAPDGTPDSPLMAAERAALRAALREHEGSRRDLARRLGLSERTLYRKLRSL
jgi:two-component system, NtrC family, response regulator HydG